MYHYEELEKKLNEFYNIDDMEAASSIRADIYLGFIEYVAKYKSKHLSNIAKKVLLLDNLDLSSY